MDGRDHGGLCGIGSDDMVLFADGLLWIAFDQYKQLIGSLPSNLRETPGGLCAALRILSANRRYSMPCPRPTHLIVFFPANVEEMAQ